MAVKWGVLGTASIARGCTIPGMKEAEIDEKPASACMTCACILLLPQITGK